jgi:tellurite methyltransferase
MTSHFPESNVAIIDLRSAEQFAHDRPQGAVHFSMQDLRERAYLLPPRSRPLIVIGNTSEDCRIAMQILQQADRPVQSFLESQWRSHLPNETGIPSQTALWEPAAIVQRAIAEYAALSPAERAPERRSPGKRALDVACGTGRNTVYLAQQGFSVLGVDWLPDALSRAQDLAKRSGVLIATAQKNLEEADALQGIEAEFIVVVRYLDRNLFRRLCDALSPGGILVYETFTIAQMAMGHPRNPLYLLQPDELRQAFAHLDILHYAEDLHDGAHTAQLIARKPHTP